MALIVWRIVKSKYADSAFDGEGARLYGGRWNSVGTSMVYASESASLALVELLVHLGSSSALRAYSMVRAEIEETDVVSPDVRDLPEDWTQIVASRRTRAYGDEWARGLGSLALRVPSVVVPMENNFLINPRHPGFVRLTIQPPMTLPLDPRLAVRGHG